MSCSTWRRAATTHIQNKVERVSARWNITGASKISVDQPYTFDISIFLVYLKVDTAKLFEFRVSEQDSDFLVILTFHSSSRFDTPSVYQIRQPLQRWLWDVGSLFYCLWVFVNMMKCSCTYQVAVCDVRDLVRWWLRMMTVCPYLAIYLVFHCRHCHWRNTVINQI
jgi:hypothetical protein